jgi:hypothetical protein
MAKYYFEVHLGKDNALAVTLLYLLLDTYIRHQEKLYTEAGSRNQRAVESSKKWMLILAHPSHAWRDPALPLGKRASLSYSREWR